VNPTVIPPIPFIKDNEQRLAKMRRQLEGMFRSLYLVHDEIGVATSFDIDPGIAARLASWWPP
jgi:hypothetical protein